MNAIITYILVQKMSEEHKDVTFIKVDVDELSELSSGRCGVTCMPTFHAYKGGKKVADFSGADQSKLRALLWICRHILISVQRHDEVTTW